MKILMIGRNDPASMMITFSNAINKYTEHTSRVIAFEERYVADYEKDILVSDIEENDYGEIEELLRTSEIFHFHMTIDEGATIGPLCVRDYISGKKILHHHHGHPDFRGNPDIFAKKYRELNRKTIVATPDLLKLLPEATWQPNMVPLNHSDYMPRKEALSDKPVKVVQSPTRKYLKNTKELEQAMSDICNDGLETELHILEGYSHRDCLAFKKNCHIVFDHMQGYFGISSLESLSQGLPVLAGVDDYNIKAIKNFTGSDNVPWVITRNVDALDRELRRLILDLDVRVAVGKSSRKFMESYWTEQHALEVLTNTYKEL